jgi:AbrB family looped-hinge helix DNA binding protein
MTIQQFLADVPSKWEDSSMSDTFKLTVGDKGRVVIPAEIRSRHNWEQGTELILIESDSGVSLTTKAESLKKLRGILTGNGYSVDQFIAEKREESRLEDEKLGM